MHSLLFLRTLFLLAAMERLAPDVGRDDRHAIAAAIAESDASDLEAEWLVAIAFRESTFRADAVGDHDTSFCWAQVHFPGGRRTREGWSGNELAGDAGRCATVALRILRTSFSACGALPQRERLAAFAAGSCSSLRGRRLSRDRDAMRVRAFGGAS